MTKCRSCDCSIPDDKYVCDECYRDPETNNCVRCDTHLNGIVYEYVCGFCIDKEQQNVRSRVD